MVPFSGIVSRSSVPNSTEWTRSLIDTKGIVAARSRNPERFVGKSAPPQYMHLISGKDEGLVKVMSVEGVPLFVAFKRTALSGWLANVAIPVEVMEATAARARTTIFLSAGRSSYFSAASRFSTLATWLTGSETWLPELRSWRRATGHRHRKRSPFLLGRAHANRSTM
jgi:hypothetical protein